MDLSHNLILLNGEPKTLQIDSIERNSTNGYRVRFKNNGKDYNYGHDKVAWLSNPECIDSAYCKVFINGSQQYNISEVWKFADASKCYWRIIYTNGYVHEGDESKIAVVTSCLGEEASRDLLSYLRNAATINPLGKGNDSEGILADMYADVDFVDTNSAAACYLNPDKHKPKHLKHSDLIYPFGCNASQKKAVAAAFEHQMSVIQGPPGTGKTTTLVEAIYETLHRENQVMVCAQSNTAVDWISEKLVDRGIHVLRIGNPTRINDKMLSFTYERRFESHPDYAELWGIRKAIREIQSNLRKKSHGEKETARNRLSRLRFRATELEVKIDTELFDEARVVACTLVGSANRVLTNRNFTTLFIDEAAQALEAACWIAIGKADRVILAGDHHQLPPTIKCIEAARGGLDHTLMQKITDRKPETVSLLKTQYRMNESIMRFPSRWFYRDELQSAPEVKHRGILEFDTPVVWLDTADCHFEEDQHTDSMSRINKDEATLLVSTLQKYIEKIGKERVLDESIDFGLISPYKSQVQYIRGLIKRNVSFKPFRRLITVHTVDGFQGQERDVIMISLVRANDKGRIGFLGDLRRMNVAITRARMKLMILGDAPTLTRHVFYKELYEYIRENGQVVDVHPHPPP